MIILINFNGFPDKQRAGEKESDQKLMWLIWSDEPFDEQLTGWLKQIV